MIKNNAFTSIPERRILDSSVLPPTPSDALPGNNNSKIILTIQAKPHFRINEGDANAIVEVVKQKAHQELLPIIDKLGGDEVLQNRVRRCLERQLAFIHED